MGDQALMVLNKNAFSRNNENVKTFRVHNPKARWKWQLLRPYLTNILIFLNEYEQLGEEKSWKVKIQPESQLFQGSSQIWKQFWRLWADEFGVFDEMWCQR